jgi:hypothetical protein
MPPAMPLIDDEWSSWVPLGKGPVASDVPAAAGLYRIRTDHDDVLDYVGQTGIGTMNLRKRLAMLSGIWGGEMPYRDPHTAAPALWAWIRSGRRDVEASVYRIEGDVQLRKAFECLAIARHRWRFEVSPRWNFGRMPADFSMSSGNNARLVAAGRRFRGAPCTSSEPGHVAGVGPVSRPGDDPVGDDWGGLDWCRWTPMAQAAASAKGSGIYRVRDGSSGSLIYVGEGVVASRLRTHLAKARQPEHRQARWFAMPGVDCSWVQTQWLAHQRQEIENDLIANHVDLFGVPPAAQFLG